MKKPSTKDAISRAEWLAIYAGQGGRCAICQKPLRNRFDSSGEGETGAVDHCHAKEKRLKADGVPPRVALRRSIRALLCAYECNKRHFLRYWSDHPERLQRAFAVATQFPAQAYLNHESPPEPESESFDTCL